MRNNFLDMSNRNKHCPLLAVRGHQNQSCHRQTSDFPEALVQATLHCVGQTSLRMADLGISLFVWICIASVFCLLNESNNRTSGLLVPSKL